MNQQEGHQDESSRREEDSMEKELLRDISQGLASKLDGLRDLFQEMGNQAKSLADNHQILINASYSKS